MAIASDVLSMAWHLYSLAIIGMVVAGVAVFVAAKDKSAGAGAEAVSDVSYGIAWGTFGLSVVDVSGVLKDI